MKNKILAMALLLVFLFAGCSTGGGQSGENESRAEEAASSEEAGQEPGDALEPWRQAYYEVLMESISAPEFGEISNVYIYYASNQDSPVLKANYDKSATEPEIYTKVWKMEQGKAVRTYLGREFGETVNMATGNLIKAENVQNVKTYSELSGNNLVPLFQIRSKEGQESTVVTVQDGKSWTEQEVIDQKVLEQFHLPSIVEELWFTPLQVNYTAEMIKEKITDYFLETYKPEIPDGAPDWVKEYLAYFKRKLVFSYSTYPKEQNMKTISLYEPVPQEGAPVVEYMEYETTKNQVVLCGGKALENLAEENSKIYTDDKGNVFEIVWNGQNGFFYVLGENGKEGLFSMQRMADWSEGPGFAAIEGTQKEFSSVEEAEQWMENKISATLLSKGFGGSLRELEMQTYPLPEYAVTWAEFEKVLMGIFVQHAQAYGQWRAAV